MWTDRNKKQVPMTDTLIGAGTEIEGNLTTQAGIRIEGLFKGMIECQGDVVIGENGTAHSNIAARNVTIAGKIFGDVTTRGKLTILASGSLQGNVTAHALVIEEGGRLNGTTRMDKADKANKPDKGERTDKTDKLEEADGKSAPSPTEPVKAGMAKAKQAG